MRYILEACIGMIMVHMFVSLIEMNIWWLQSVPSFDTDHKMMFGVLVFCSSLIGIMVGELAYDIRRNP